MNWISEADQRDINAALGDGLASLLSQPVDDLAKTPSEVVTAARSLPARLALPFLRALTSPDEHRYLPWFVEEVVEGDRPAAQWGQGGVLVPSRSITELARTPLVEVLAAVPSGRWVMLPPDATGWARGDETIGAPAVRRDDLDHRFQVPAGVSRLHLRSTVPVPVAQPLLVARRWLASRLAWAMAEGGTTRRQLEPLTDDAHVALRALALEAAGPHHDEASTVPGFRGPDEWFD